MFKNIESGGIVVVHDSASSLPVDYCPADYNGLVEVPFAVTGSRDGKYIDWVDHPFVSDDERGEFIHDLETAKLVTSQPNPEYYQKVLKDIIATGITKIAIIPMSGKLSGSYESAKSAADALKNQADIAVANCRTVSIGQGLLVTQADIENRNGDFNNAAELVARVEELSKGVHVAQGFSDLEHLRRGGRIGLASNMIGGILGVIPIIGVNEEGVLDKIDKKRGWKNARESMIDYVSEEVGKKAVRLALVHFATNQLDNLRDDINGRFVMATDDGGKEYDILECEERMAIATHSGVGLLALGR